MKLFKIINVSSNGSFYFHYQQINLIKKNNKNIFQKNDDKNFILNKKKTTSSNTFRQSLHYKNKYL